MTMMSVKIITPLAVIYAGLLLLPEICCAQHSGLTIAQDSSKKITKERDTVIVQDVIGSVFEKESYFVLPGATVVLRSGNDGKYRGTVTDAEGNFTFKNIPPGRYDLQVSFVGYTSVYQSIEVNSARHLQIEIPLEESVLYLSTVEIKSFENLSPVGGSAIDQVQFKYHPGNRYEAIRKVAVLPGIQNADDSRNDIIIRGNSPQSVIWRIEGINISNPNHFNIPGTSGGPISIINDKVLGTSSFYSGAFPAIYGNTTSGIFDLRYRNGDSIQWHGTLQFGFLGAEAVIEGPLSKRNKSTILLSVRRSILGAFRKFNIDIGTSSLPKYSDLAFKINLPLHDGSVFWLFGLGGTSNVDIRISRQDILTKNIYGEKDRDQFFSSRLGMVGFGYKRHIGAKGYLVNTTALLGDRVNSVHDFVYPADMRSSILAVQEKPGSSVYPRVLTYRFTDKKISGSLFVTWKLRSRNHLSSGMTYDLQKFEFLDSAINLSAGSEMFGKWRIRWNTKQYSALLQPFAQWKYTGKKTDLVAGIHGQYLSFTKSSSIEPRIALRYYVSDRSAFNAGFGMHSQTQQPYLHFYGQTTSSDNVPVAENAKLDFTRSLHTVAGYQRKFGRDTSLFTFKGEVYYQRIYDVPVEVRRSSFSLLNAGADFKRLYPNTLVNDGTGRNYGIETMLEKSFSKNYMLLLSASWFESKYRGSDRVWRNSDFNSRFIVNVLTTREWHVRKHNVLSLGFKFTATGGRWYGDVDTLASRQEMDVVYVEGTKNTKQFSPYHRFDLRVTYKINRKRVNHEISVDFINIFDNHSIHKLTFVPDRHKREDGQVRNEYQLGFIPFFYYRFDF
jgi:hypothetical protein